MYDEKVRKMLARKDWQQEPYKGLKIAGIDILFWISIIYFIVWGVFIATAIIGEEILPPWTKITLLMITFGAGVPLLVASCIVQFAKGVK
jgi:hypothetical protein